MEDKKVLESRSLELSEKSQVLIELVELEGKGQYISLNKQWRKANGDWQYGKGFWIKVEAGDSLLHLLAEVLGFDVKLDLD